MDSNPTASPTSISPLRIWFATAETAIRPEEQKLRRETSDLVNDPTLTARFWDGCIERGENVPVDDLEGDGLGDTSGEGGGTSIVRSLGREDSSCDAKERLPVSDPRLTKRREAEWRKTHRQRCHR